MSQPTKTKKTTSSPTKTGSGSTPKVDPTTGAIDLASVPRVPGPGKGGAALQDRSTALQREAKARQDMMGPIPAEAAADPVGWAERHIESIAPVAAKEVEYAVKFGSDQLRYIAARDALAMKGITTKPKEAGVIPQAMVFQFNGPVTGSGVPILPFSNAAAALPSGTAPATVDATATTVTVDAAPTTKPDKT